MSDSSGSSTSSEVSEKGLGLETRGGGGEEDDRCSKACSNCFSKFRPYEARLTSISRMSDSSFGMTTVLGAERIVDMRLFVLLGFSA